MNFLNATTDITFKKLFGTEEHKNILLSFLNNVLKRSKKDKIIDVTFLDPYNPPTLCELRRTSHPESLPAIALASCECPRRRPG
jgi:hypothetical protein